LDHQADADETPAIPTLAAVCGLFCEACSIYIAGREDPERLALLAARFGQSEEETYCDGCRAEKRMAYCRSCTMFLTTTRRSYSQESLSRIR
jgi:hypothetical protein